MDFAAVTLAKPRKSTAIVNSIVVYPNVLFIQNPKKLKEISLFCMKGDIISVPKKLMSMHSVEWKTI